MSRRQSRLSRVDEEKSAMEMQGATGDSAPRSHDGASVADPESERTGPASDQQQAPAGHRGGDASDRHASPAATDTGAPADGEGTGKNRPGSNLADAIARPPSAELARNTVGRRAQKGHRSLRRSKLAAQQLREELVLSSRQGVRGGSTQTAEHGGADGTDSGVAVMHPRVFGSTSSSDRPESPLFIDADHVPKTANLHNQLMPFPDPIPTKKKGRLGTRFDNVKKWYQRQKRSDLNPVFRKRIKEIESQYGSGYASFFTFIRFNLMVDIALAILWLGLVILPTAFTFDYDGVSSSFKLQNMFDGTGYLGETWMFYGGYRSTTNGYHIDFFYLCLIYVTFFGTMAFVLRKIIGSLSSTGMIHAENKAPFSSMVLTSWDFSLATCKGVAPMQMALSNSLQEFLAELDREKDMFVRTKSERYKLYARRVLMWMLTVIIMGGAFAAVYFTVKLDTENKVAGGSTNLWKTYGPSIVFSAINAIVPTILELLVIWSNYSSTKLDINITVSKIYILRIVNIYAFIFGLMVEVNKEDTTVTCGGTYMGQSLYRLVIIDTLSTAASRLVIDYLYFYWFNKRRELYISQGVLNVIYRQALIWIGAMFSPVLPLIGVASLALYFLVYYNIVIDTSSLPEKRYSQTSRDNTFFLGLVFLTIVLVALPGSVLTTTDLVNMDSAPFINGSLQSGGTCGPFERLPATGAYGRVAAKLPSWLESVLDWMQSAVVIIPLLFIMVIVIYYQSTQLGYERSRVKQLKRQLDQEQLFSRHVLQSTSTSGSSSTGGSSSTIGSSSSSAALKGTSTSTTYTNLSVSVSSS